MKFQILNEYISKLKEIYNKHVDELMASFDSLPIEQTGISLMINGLLGFFYDQYISRNDWIKFTKLEGYLMNRKKMTDFNDYLRKGAVAYYNMFDDFFYSRSLEYQDYAYLKGKKYSAAVAEILECDPSIIDNCVNETLDNMDKDLEELYKFGSGNVFRNYVYSLNAQCFDEKLGDAIRECYVYFDVLFGKFKIEESRRREFEDKFYEYIEYVLTTEKSRQLPESFCKYLVEDFKKDGLKIVFHK